jgi:hypothetical protein
MKNRLPMWVFFWLSVLSLVAAIVFVCYFQKTLFLVLACVSFFIFAVMTALFVYFAVKYSRAVNPAEPGPGPKAH